MRHGGWFHSRLHQSTVSLAEPRARNSTHDEDVVAPTAAFAFQNVTAATSKPATRRSVDLKQEVMKDNTSGEDAESSPSPDSDFVEPDDRHEEAVDALASYFVPGSRSGDNSGRSGGGSNGGFGAEDASTHALDDHDHRRAHAIAPPGYGKTLLSLLTLKEVMARDQTKVKTAIYVVPTLPLTDQTLTACDKYGVFRNIPHKRLIVSSGTSRTEERTTKPEVIARFLADSAAASTANDEGAVSSSSKVKIRRLNIQIIAPSGRGATYHPKGARSGIGPLHRLCHL